MWSITTNSNKKKYIFICFSNPKSVKNSSLLQSQQTVKRKRHRHRDKLTNNYSADIDKPPTKAEIELLYEKYLSFTSMIIFIYDKIII